MTIAILPAVAQIQGVDKAKMVAERFFSQKNDGMVQPTVVQGDSTKVRSVRKAKRVLNIDEELYKNDEEMMLIVRRLLSAASDADLRHDMNVEDEYFSAIETRDTAILLRDKQLAEQGAQLKEQGAQLKEQGAQLKEQGAQLKEQGAQLKEQGAQLKEQESMLRTSVKLLLQAGVPKNVVAVNLGKTVEEIDSLSLE